MYIFYKNLADLRFNNSHDFLGEVQVLLGQDGEHVDVRLAVERQVLQRGEVLPAGVFIRHYNHWKLTAARWEPSAHSPSTHWRHLFGGKQQNVAAFSRLF